MHVQVGGTLTLMDNGLLDSWSFILIKFLYYFLQVKLDTLYIDVDYMYILLVCAYMYICRCRYVYVTSIRLYVYTQVQIICICYQYTFICIYIGVDDMDMCELSLDQTGLARKKGAEILAESFDSEWNSQGGQRYLRQHKKAISSEYLRQQMSQHQT